jgi:inner membrane protein
MSTAKTIFEKVNNWVKTSIALRVFTITFLVLILLIPIEMVESLIYQRGHRQDEAVREVSQKWGNRQTLSGPVLTVPYSHYSTMVDEEGETTIKKAKQYAHFLPFELDIENELEPEKRYRGIYEVIVYKSKVNLSGHFEKPDFKKLNIEEENVLWEEATVAIGLSDLRSIQNSVKLQWNGEKYAFNPGLKTKDVISRGISTPVSLNAKRLDFKIDLSFNGSQNISFTPFGRTTHVVVKSPWKDPSFTGAFLPDKREITDAGFVAEWEVLHLNRSYPQEFVGEEIKESVRSSVFGTDLLLPVDEYKKSTRSVKYAVLFIGLTFLLFFFVQIINKVRIHPIQYLIVGLALCLFFTLLVALSEHISFLYSYTTASIAIILMITGFAKAIFKNNKLTLILAGLLSVLYAFIYVIIQLQDYSLLIGSAGLLSILGSLMYLSRNIDWYTIGESK